MKQSGMAVVSLLFILASCLSLSAQAQSGTPANDTRFHGIVPVILTQSLDSKKLKQGDEVLAKTAVTMKFPSGLMIPAGTKVVGHVTQASSRSKGEPESSLGIVFDKIEAPESTLDMNGVMQAVGPNPSASSGPDTSSMLGGNNMSSGDGSTSAAGPGVGMQPGKQAPMMLNPHSSGVVGIHNLKMGSDSVLTSSEKQVKLDSGSQIMIHAQ